MKKNIRFENKDYDLDSCPETWKMYTEAYKTSFEDLLNFDLLEDKGTNRPPRCYIKSKKSSEESNLKLKMAGDTIFNFGSNKSTNTRRNRYYEKYKNLLYRDFKDDEDKLQEYLGELKDCNKKYHELENFSFMPMTGGMQAVKGIFLQENIAAFIAELEDYYKKKKLGEEDNHCFMTYRKGEGRGKISPKNKEALKNFLKSFIDHIDYFERIYLVNYNEFEELIKINAGKIDSGKKVVNYMGFAKKYWIARGRIGGATDLFRTQFESDNEKYTET